MGFFSKIKEGLSKTKDKLSRKIFEAFKAKKLDEEFYEELENALISSDMGVTATENIIEELKVSLFKNKITDPEKAKEELRRILIESIEK